MKQTNLKYKIKIAFGICVLFILILLGVMYFYVNNTAKESIKTDTAIHILNSIENITAKIQMAEADKRKFLQENNSTIKKSYDENIQKIYEEIEAISTLSSQSVTKMEDIETLKSLFDAKKNYAEKLMSANEISKINPALFQIRGDTDRILLENTYAAIKKMKQDQRAYLHSSNEARGFYTKKISILSSTK